MFQEHEAPACGAKAALTISGSLPPPTLCRGLLGLLAQLVSAHNIPASETPVWTEEFSSRERRADAALNLSDVARWCIEKRPNHERLIRKLGSRRMRPPAGALVLPVTAESRCNGSPWSTFIAAGV